MRRRGGFLPASAAVQERTRIRYDGVPVSGSRMSDRSARRIQQLISYPREDLGIEHKGRLDLKSNEHRATLAKAAIALANHGGGYIVLGFVEHGSDLLSQPRSAELPAVTQDAVNEAIRRYADPEFHCPVDFVTHAQSGVEHPVVHVPGTSVPVMARRDCSNVIAKHRCYIRKPGPRSEEPQTGDEWRRLLDRCVRSSRSAMLDAFRGIVEGSPESAPAPDEKAQLRSFCDDSRRRWEELVEQLPEGVAARFPFGWYEIGVSLLGGEPAASVTELRERLAHAQSIQLTGWPPFLDWDPYPHGQCVEAWAGQPAPNGTMDDPSLCDYWRSALDGNLYTIRGYTEDGMPDHQGGTVMDLSLPIWRVAESILFAGRFADTFKDTDQIVVRCRFVGLNGRRLARVTSTRWPLPAGTSKTSEITSNIKIDASQVQENIIETVQRTLRPLYELFDFFSLPEVLVRNDVNTMIERKL